MIKRYTSILIVVFLALFSCHKKKSDDRHIRNENLLIVNLDNVQKETFVNASQYFKKVTPIILETQEDCLISEIKEIQIYDNFIVILDDFVEPHLYVFNLKDGRFLHQVGRFGHGPGEYLGISDFTINQETKEICLLDQNASKIQSYNLETGQFVNSIPISSEKYHRNLQFAQGNIYLDANLKSEDEKLLYQLNLTSGDLNRGWLNATDYNRGWLQLVSLGESFFFSRNTDNPKYAQIFMDTIVTFANGQVMPYLAVESERWVDSKTLQKAYNELGQDALKNLMDQNLIFGLTRFIESENFMSFKYYDGRIQYTFISTSKGAMVCNVLIDDLLYEMEGESTIPINGLRFSDDKGVYGYSSPAQFAAYLGKDLKELVNPNIQGYEELTKLVEDSNPVVLYYEFKE